MARLRVYLDTCVIKRGWDDPAQPRIRFEVAAAEALFQMALQGKIIMLRAAVHDAENATNPNRDRREAAQEFLASFSMQEIPDIDLAEKAGVYRKKGLSPFDAVHLASAVLLSADVFVTTDDRLMRQANRLSLRVKAVGPIAFAAEMMA